MQEDPKQREIADKILAAIKNRFGFVPVVNQVLSERPDIFIPMVNTGKAILDSDSALDPKTRYLCAISAASAAGGEYCIDVQMKHALAAGATQEEILESIVIGTYMAMTKAQSYAFRRYAEMFDIKLE